MPIPDINGSFHRAGYAPLGRRLAGEEDGFTLLELLNAILILLILLSIAMPNFRLRDNTGKAAATQNAKSLAPTAQVYARRTTRAARTTQTPPARPRTTGSRG